ncbi:MAG: class I SAM-dependent methyltransferase, partial [Acidimicrobiales bacterium]
VLSVLDVGSMAKKEQDTYRPLFAGPRYSFTGLDIAEGPNVDLVPQDVFSWKEIPSQSYDVVISGQALEHNPYFWITLAEVARVLVQGGLAAIVAPGGGAVHRYPFDCWRFYPDAWPAACAFVGLELIEHAMEDRPPDQRMTGFAWRDNFMVARAPTFTDRASEEAHYARLAAIVATRTAMPEVGPEALVGSAWSLYEQRRAVACPDVRPAPADPTKAWMRAMAADARTRVRSVGRRLKKAPGSTSERSPGSSDS